jgi:hypothetical protein
MGDAPVAAAMRTLAGQYPRYGYRRVRIFLPRQGRAMSADRAYRLAVSKALKTELEKQLGLCLADEPDTDVPTSRHLRTGTVDGGLTAWDRQPGKEC